MRRIFIIFLSIVLPSVSCADQLTTTGTVTFFSLSKSVTKYTALNFYHYDVFNFKKKELSGKTFDSGISQTNFQTAIAYQYLPWLNLSFGHIYQVTNPRNESTEREHRIFQQVIFARSVTHITLTHRFRLEERFIKGKEKSDFRTRLRYQLGGKLPLRGLQVDPGEFYLNAYNEFYFSTTGKRNALFSDDWLFAGLGFTTKDLGAFEVGPLIQWARINQDKDTRSHLTLQAGWIYRF